MDYKMRVNLGKGVDKAAVQRAMFEMGYGWGHEQAMGVRWEESNDFAYVVDATGTIWRIVCEEYDTELYKGVQEFVLIGNKLVEKQAKEEEKPTLGLRPRWIASSDRLSEILEAMQRYVQQHKRIPAEWIEEMQELNAHRKA